MHEFPLIADLALILIAAGVTSVVCRKFKLPILVGYLLAGVLCGPYFTFLPSVVDTSSIKTWSEIGVIFLLFALGLEFNFKNLFKVGKTGAITVACILTGMMACCMGIGQLLGWSTVTCIFMGGIMSISSTMVIVKAFEELKLKGQPFTHIVYGVMIMQDILGIVLMVILSTLAISQNASILEEVSTTSMKVVFFLVLWFVGGILIVPTLLRKLKNHLSDEILLIISLALCLGMVMLADASHLSTALGAFTIGSILGSTTEAHRIEHLMAPIKNLFGAVFFVSVGMMVNPGAVLDNIGTLVLLFVLLIILNPVMGTLGVFLSGKSLKTALKSGACFGQIGEFSFIIANLGVSLGVLNDFTYPLIITVSAITMVTTPYMLKGADKLTDPIAKLLPEKFKYRAEEDRRAPEVKAPNRKVILLKHFVTETFILSMILLGIILLIGGYIEPHLEPLLKEHVNNPVFVSKCICIVVTLLAMMPFLSALILRKNKLNRAFVSVMLHDNSRGLLRFFQGLRILITAAFISFALVAYSPFEWYINSGIGVVLLLIVSVFDFMFKNYIVLERQFLLNYNDAEASESESEDASKNAKLPSVTDLRAVDWLSDDISVLSYHVDEDSPFLNRQLIDINLRAKLKLFVMRIEREDETASVNIPVGQETVRLGDLMYIVGRPDCIQKLAQSPYGISDKKLHIQTLKQFKRELDEARTDASMLKCIRIHISHDSPFAHQTVKTSNIRECTGCLVIGLEIGGRVEMNPDLNATFEPNSQVWVIGEADSVAKLIEENMAKRMPAEGAA